MDDFDQYDEFGNYIGPILDQELQDIHQHLFQSTNADLSPLPSTNNQNFQATANQHTQQSYHQGHYDSSVEVLIASGDANASHQSLMQSSSAIGLDQFSAGAQFASAGYGSLTDYQSSFCLSESILPPLSIAKHSTYSQLIHDLLSEQWLQRQFTLIGGHLHGKTALLDLFFSQLHPHINLQSITPEIPAQTSTPHNLKPTSLFPATYDISLNQSTHGNTEPNPGNNRVKNCWPVQYADSLYRERAIGHSTSLKPITIPVQALSPLLDSHSQHYSANFHSPLALKTYLFSVTDTPAQSDYVDSAVLAIQRCSGSGVVLVVDVVEGLTAEIELQLEYAIRGACPMLLVLTKMDRLITELRVPPQDAYVKITNVIEAINIAMLQYYNMYYGLQSTHEPEPTPDRATATRYRCPLFNPIEHNVVFCSTLHSWAFTIKSFAMLYLTQQDIKASRGIGPQQQHQNVDPRTGLPLPIDFNTNSTNAQKMHKLILLLWGNIYYDPTTKQFLKQPPSVKDNRKTYRTFVEFILMPLYKMYSACLTGSAPFLESILGSFYQPFPFTPTNTTSGAMTNASITSMTTFAPFAIPPHILASSQDDLLREIVGLWLFAPSHLSTINQRSHGGYDSEDFSLFSPIVLSKPTQKEKAPLHTRLPSNANCAAHLLASSILDVLPPPIIRKPFVQQTTLLYQTALALGSVPPLSELQAQQSKLTQTHPQSKHNPQLRTARLPPQKYFPPCRVGLADVITVMPHPNGTTLDFLCKVHTLAINNDPLFVEQEEQDDLHGSAKSRVAFSVGDKITLFRTDDKSYSPPHHLVGIFAPCANRYRTPLQQCYDGNLVVLSFSTQSSNPGSEPIAVHSALQQPDSILLQKFHLSGHGTFINHSVTLLGESQRLIKGVKQHNTSNQSQPRPIRQLEELDIKLFIPTFIRPLVHPGSDIFSVAIEPTVASELPILLSTLQRAQAIYGSSLKISQGSTGTHTLSMRGEFLADDIIHYLRVVTGNLAISSTIGQYDKHKIVPPNLQQLSFAISAPFYNFREGIRGTSATECKSSSVGYHNSFTTTASAATDSNSLADQISFAQANQIHSDRTHFAKQYQNYLNWSSRQDSLHIVEPSHLAKSLNHLVPFNNSVTTSAEERQDRESIIWGSNRLFSLYHGTNKLWGSVSSTHTPWSFGLLDDANVQLLDMSTKGSHGLDEDVPFLSPSDWKFDHIASIVNGFNRLSREGPLTESPLHNMTLQLDEVNISTNPLQGTSRHIIPTIRKSLSGAILLAEPLLYEPMTRGEIIVNKKYEPEIHKVLAQRRGHVLSQVPIPLTPYIRYSYKLPSIESMGFGIEIRVASKGQSRLSGSYHQSYEKLAGDPLDQNIAVSVVKVAALQDLPRDLMVKTRRRKGLPEFALQHYLDEDFLKQLSEGQ